MISKNSTLSEVFEQKGVKAEKILTPILGDQCVYCPLAQQEKIIEALQKHDLSDEEIDKIIAKLNSD